MNLLAIFIGGGLGSLARFGVGKAVVAGFGSNLPIGTLVANLLSCVVLGLALGAFKDKVLADPMLRGLIVIGFCGGFSTFSTFSFETQQLMRDGQMLFAVANILISVAFCILLLFWLIKQ